MDPLLDDQALAARGRRRARRENGDAQDGSGERVEAASGGSSSSAPSAVDRVLRTLERGASSKRASRGDGGGGEEGGAEEEQRDGNGEHKVGEEEPLDKEEILRMVEEAPPVPELEPGQLRQLVARLERAASTNLEMRAKFPDEPAKFMDSELALDEAVVALKPLASSPALYPEFLRLNALEAVLALLVHENTDIGLAAISLLNELLDSDVVGEDERARALPEAFLKQGGHAALLATLQRLDEGQPEDAQGVNDALSVFESLIEFRTSLCAELCTAVPLLDFVVARVQVAGVDENGEQAAELLAMLLELGGEQAVAAASAKRVVQALLRALEPFRAEPAKAPTAGETEFAANLIGALRALLSGDVANQRLFLKQRGLATVFDMIRHHRHLRLDAVKAIDVALAWFASACEAFVDEGGLRLLFAALPELQPGASNEARRKHANDEAEAKEHVVSALAQLLVHCSDVRFLRVLRKFEEDDGAKSRWLARLCQERLARVRAAERERGYAPPQAAANEDDNELYLARLDAGLYTVQLAALILALLLTSRTASLVPLVRRALADAALPPAEVRAVVAEFERRVDSASPFKPLLGSVLRLMDDEASDAAARAE